MKIIDLSSVFKVLVIFIMMVLYPLSYPLADPSTTIAVERQTMMQTMWNTMKDSYDAVMRSQTMTLVATTVQQARVLYDNYIQSMKYYELINKLSKHQGGFMGYVSDTVKDRVTSFAEAEKNRVMAMREGNSNNILSNYVNKWKKDLTPGDIGWTNFSQDVISGKYVDVKKIEDDMNILEKMDNYVIKETEDAEKSDKALAQTIQDANKPMDSKGMQEVQTKLLAQIAMLEQKRNALERANLALEIKKQKEELVKKSKYVNESIEYGKAVGLFLERQSQAAKSGEMTRQQALDVLGSKPTGGKSK